MSVIPKQIRLRRILFGIAAFLAAAGSLAQSPQSDANIARAIESELEYSDLLDYSGVQISVEDGIVNFAGRVPSITATRQVEQVAATVRGVRGIVNRLEIEAPFFPAPVLEDAAREALDDNRATDLYQIEVAASGEGRVTLDGTVDSWAERSLAETVVGEVAGVRAIDNRIAVEEAELFRATGEIDADITERLRWDARVDDSLIAVLVREGGRVTLSGTVGSLAEKDLAMALAHVAGVRQVDAMHLDVESWARDPDRRLGTEKPVPDSEIRAAIERGLAIDPRVASREIDVSVTAGESRLTGFVDSLAESRAAERTARNTYGVGRIHNELAIRPQALDDAEMERRARTALMSSPALADRELELAIVDGQARLSGDVRSAGEYRAADEMVANTAGIESLTNELTIRGESPRIALNPYMDTVRLLMPADSEIPTERELYAAVQSELFWSPFVDEDQVEIEVNGGTVTLTGVVDSYGESISAAENAIEAGALSVNNQLEIE